MQKIGNSTLWEYKYRPQTIEDLILPDNIKTYFQNIVNKKDMPNLILHSPPGSGKCLDFDEEIEIFIDEKYFNMF